MEIKSIDDIIKHEATEVKDEADGVKYYLSLSFAAKELGEELLAEVFHEIAEDEYDHMTVACWILSESDEELPEATQEAIRNAHMMMPDRPTFEERMKHIK